MLCGPSSTSRVVSTLTVITVSAKEQTHPTRGTPSVRARRDPRGQQAQNTEAQSGEPGLSQMPQLCIPLGPLHVGGPRGPVAAGPRSPSPVRVPSSYVFLCLTVVPAELDLKS